MAKGRPGRLDQRIEILREVLADDGYGGQTITLETVANVWANVTPQGGREAELADRLNGEGVYIFKIRNRRDLAVEENYRIRWDGRDYNVRFPATEGVRVQYIEITGERGVAM